MQQEIFGPVLPVLPYEKLDDCIDFIRSRPKPLALYIFSENKMNQEKVLNSCSFGGGCINDTVIHLASFAHVLRRCWRVRHGQLPRQKEL